MNSIGEILKKTREEKGFSLEEVVHETNISKHYIESLESEDFEAFPAEAYLLGFLRNYAEFLALDPARVIGLYKNMKLSEEPTPIAELVGKKREIPWKMIILGVVVLALIGGGIALIPTIKGYLEERAAIRAAENPPPTQEVYTLESDFFETTVRTGDQIVIPQGEDNYIFNVEYRNRKVFLTADNPVLFDDRDSSFSLERGEEIFLSLIGESPDVRIFAKDLSSDDETAVIQVQRLEKISMDTGESPDVAELDDMTAAVDSLEPPSGVSQRRIEKQIIYTARNPEAFTLNIDFKGYSLFRWRSDSSPPEDKYFKDGDAFRLDVYRSVQLWGSNAGAISAKIKDHEVPLGTGGQVTVRQILWVRNDSGTYDLVILPVY